MIQYVLYYIVGDPVALFHTVDDPILALILSISSKDTSMVKPEF